VEAVEIDTDGVTKGLTVTEMSFELAELVNAHDALLVMTHEMMSVETMFVSEYVVWLPH
jgi:hypothetical protein